MIHIAHRTLKSFLIIAFCLPLVLCGAHWINVHCDFEFAGPLTVLITIGSLILLILYLYLENRIDKEGVENYEDLQSDIIHLKRHDFYEIIILGFCSPFILTFFHRIAVEYQNLWIELLADVAYILIYWLLIGSFWLKDSIRNETFYESKIDDSQIQKQDSLKKLGQTLKSAALVVESVAVIICLYYWIINDFDNSVYDFSSKTIVVCVCIQLCWLVIEKLFSKS